MAIIRVMTFNIHGSDPEWAARHADLTLGVIRRYSPDILGLQEVAVPNIEFYRQHLTDYDHELGQKYGEEEEEGGYASIFWRKERFERIEAEDFWFSFAPVIGGRVPAGCDLDQAAG